jgi:integrase
MAGVWIKSKTYPGVRFRLHPTRKHGVGPDKYLTIFYKLDGKMVQESLGWTSKTWTESGPEGKVVKCGWTEKRAAALLAELQENQRLGTGPRTLAERREMAEQARLEAEAAKLEAEEAAQAEQALNVTWGEVWPKYIGHSQANKKPNTVRTEKLFEQHWIRPGITAKTPLRSVSPFHLEKIKARMIKDGKAPRSVEYTLALIRQVYNFCSINGLFHGGNPVTKSRVRAPRFDNRRLRYLSKDEADRLLSLLAGKSQDVHDISLLSLHSGARAGEIFALTWGDVDLDRHVLTLRDTKNGETRKAFTTAQAVEMLRNRKPIDPAPTALVFPAKGGKQIKAISKTFERAVDELGFNDGLTDSRDHVVFHSLRHSYASLLVENGTPLFVIKELLGHKDIRMTARYSHLGDNTMADAAKRLGGILGDQNDAGRVIPLRPAANQ